jgi:hypothetical protein
MDTFTMKSLLDRTKTRPLLLIGFIIAIAAFIWWLLSVSTQTSEIQPKENIIVNQKNTEQVPQTQIVSTPIQTMGSSVKQTITPLTATLSASRVISIVNTTSTVKTVTSALPTDTVTAAEELGRLKDEQSRLKKRKADLTKQVEISNKLLALKEQQLKSLTQNNALN